MSTDASLPTDVEALQRELVHTRSVLAETAVTCEEQRTRIEKLQAELELFQRYLYGRRSERFVEDPGQGRLFEQPAEGEPPTPQLPEAAEEQITYRRRRKGHGWSELPQQLPREEVRLEVPEAERICPCGKPLVKIGEDRVERVDYRPAKIVVKVFVSPKYACVDQHGGVKQLPTPPGPVPGGRFDFGLVAQVVTSKTCDHLPLYRQQDVLARAGIELSRSTLCEIMASAAFLLEPLAILLKRRLLASDWLGADDTPVRLLDPAHPEGVRLARFWLYRGPDKTAPYNVFDFHESRARDGPREFLGDYEGWVKVDAYGVDGGVYLGSPRIRASCCIAHARRKFDEAKSSHPRLAAEALGFFQQLYDLEDQTRELSAEARQALRQAEAVPLLEKLRVWADEQAAQALPKLKFGEALGYLRNQWEPLTNYVQDGRLPIDNNAVERDLRALTVGRRNWLFIGSKEAGPRAAILYTVVASAARHDLDVWAYVREALERLATGDTDPASLLPDVWAAAHPAAIRSYRAHEREAVAAAKRARRERRRALERAQARRR